MKRIEIQGEWLITLLLMLGCLTAVMAFETREPIVSDHVPSEMIYTGTTMRDPVYPMVGGSVFCFLRVDVPGQMQAGSIHTRINGGSWTVSPLTVEVESEPEEFWSGSVSFSAMDFVEYYFSVTGSGYDPTFVYGTDSLSFMTTDEGVAVSQAFAFMVGVPPTPTNTPMSTATPGTPTPVPSDTPAVTETPTPTFTNTPTPVMTATPTPTGEVPTITPSSTPPVTATPTASGTPMETPTPTPPPASPTPTPFPGDYLMDLVINQIWFNAGDHFLLQVDFYKKTPDVLEANLIVLLDVYGSYFFWPDWVSSLDWETVTNRSQATTYVILDFPWDEEHSTGSGIIFYSGMMNEAFSNFYGNVDWVVFGWD